MSCTANTWYNGDLTSLSGLALAGAPKNCWYPTNRSAPCMGSPLRLARASYSNHEMQDIGLIPSPTATVRTLEILITFGIYSIHVRITQLIKHTTV